MRDPPPQVIASWPAPNFVNPVTRGPGIIIINSIFFTLVLLVISLRCYTRVFITKSFGRDDILILLALIPTIGLTITVILADAKFGWNRHVWDATATEIRGGLQLQWAAVVQFTVATWLTKLSLITFYLKLITDTTHRVMKFVIYGFGILFTVGAVAMIFQMIFICRPLSAYWDFVPPTFRIDYPFKCSDISKTLLVASIANVIQTFALVVLPMPLVWRLDLPRCQRIAVMCVLSTGMLVVIASSIKTYFIDKSVVKSFDTTYDGWPAWIAAAVEIHVGLLCASAPMLRPFFQRHNLLRSPLRLPLQKGDLEIGKPSFRATIYPENVTGPAMTYKVKVYRFSRFYNRSWEDVSANKTKRDKYDRRPRDILGHKPGQRSIDKMLPPLPPDADSQSVLFS